MKGCETTKISVKTGKSSCLHFSGEFLYTFISPGTALGSARVGTILQFNVSCCANHYATDSMFYIYFCIALDGMQGNN